MVVASSARGLRLNQTPRDQVQKPHLNKVMLTFYEISRSQKISAIGAYNTVAEIKNLE